MTERTRTKTILLCEYEKYKRDRERLDQLETHCLKEGLFMFGFEGETFEIKRNVLIDDYDSASEGQNLREAIDRLGAGDIAIDKLNINPEKRDKMQLDIDELLGEYQRAKKR